MANNTRQKTMEEFCRKQEAKWQEFKGEVQESLQSKCNSPDEKMENNSKILESLIYNLDGRINSMLRMMSNEHEEDHSPVDKTLLLPTPQNKIEETEGGPKDKFN